MPIRIDNIRLGLATNSSSTHSIVLIKNPAMRKDTGLIDQYGGENFVAASSLNKYTYLATQIKHATKSIIDDDMLVDVVVNELSNGVKPADGVDHQSTWLLPTTWMGGMPDPLFIAELERFLSKEEVVILGGHDGDELHPLLGQPGVERVKLPIERFDDTSANWTCRKDFEHWILFNRKTGAKIKMTFNEKAPKFTKSQTPELVDLKITDFCPIGCEFCYMASTVKGKHATNLYSLYEALRDMKVFEVAIGGGEPTMHPSFVTMLTEFRRYNVVPNFTTKSHAWMWNDKLRVPIIENCGAFAYSISNRKEVDSLIDIVVRKDIPIGKVKIQVVMGTLSQVEFESIIEKAFSAEIGVTLLGYKTVGRGKDFKPQFYDWWFDSLLKVSNDHWGCKVGIDTALAAGYEKKLITKGIPNETFWFSLFDYFEELGSFVWHLVPLGERQLNSFRTGVVPNFSRPNLGLRGYGLYIGDPNVDIFG